MLRLSALRMVCRVNAGFGGVILHGVAIREENHMSTNADIAAARATAQVTSIRQRGSINTATTRSIANDAA